MISGHERMAIEACDMLYHPVSMESGRMAVAQQSGLRRRISISTLELIHSTLNFLQQQRGLFDENQLAPAIGDRLHNSRALLGQWHASVRNTTEG